MTAARPLPQPPARPLRRGVRRCVRRGVRRFVRREQGAAVVEFAVVVPVLLTLLMGIIDFARMYAVAASLAAAVRDGARLGAASADPGTADKAAVQARVVAAFQPLGGAALSANNVSVTLDNNANVVVRVTGYTYAPITPIAQLAGLGTVTLTRTATFRWERAS